MNNFEYKNSVKIIFGKGEISKIKENKFFNEPKENKVILNIKESIPYTINEVDNNTDTNTQSIGNLTLCILNSNTILLLSM